MSIAGNPAWTNQDILLYHGTTDDRVQGILDGIDVSLGNEYADFGRGFYTSSRLDQALRWANRGASRFGGSAAVIEFAVSREELAHLESLFFILGDPRDVDYWSFVNCCRRTGGHHMRLYGSPWYDMVVGSVAGDWREKKVARAVMDQLSFHTSRGTLALDRSRKERVI